MQAVAYCAQSFADVARQVIGGVTPITCPWTDADSFNFNTLKAADFWYIDLHGVAGWPMWYGDNGITALRASQLEKADLSNLIIFAVNCHLADDNSPMLHALLAGRPKWVVAAPGKNFSPPTGALYGAALLAQWFYRLLRLKFPPEKALEVAKLRVEAGTVLATGSRRKIVEAANADAMGFQLFKGQ